MTHPLTVLVTRPSPAGEVLCELIETQGNHAIYLPMIAFEPPQDIVAYQQAIEQLGEQSWLVFISPQAVYASIPDLRRRWPVLPPDVKFAAVGAGTAAALREAGYLSTIWPATEWTSEGLLDLPEFRSVRDVNIAIIRGEGGREYIDQVLSERGAVILRVIAYRRVMPHIDMMPVLQQMKQQPLDVMICTSGAAIQHLKIMVGEQGWPLIQDVNVIVMSQRIKRLAENIGFQKVCVVTNAIDTNHAILEMIARIKELT